ncbi:MAG: peptidoglycan/LPS O-acetylase OafA/YrhL [Desulforhopalus sp.]
MHYLNTSRDRYRADIDGIRSLAVLAVFFFHLQPNLLPGGFLGVDVFFVISGYLISGILLRENFAVSFSFTHFYARRVKRIFPALFVVLFLSAVVATFLLTPDTYTNFMRSAQYASGQLANFFFSRDVGYFSEGFSEQPLLHTWSLGVEEQFYLFWPLLIYSCFKVFSQQKGLRSNQDKTEQEMSNCSVGKESNIFAQSELRKKIGAVMLVISLLSFLACFFLAETNYNLAFYMFYTRALEFCVGALIALRILPEAKSKPLAGLLGIIGVVLLCYSFIFVKEEYLGVSFLRFGVLLPCLGTALIIHADPQRGFANMVLGTRFPVYIGKISYSLYLYHWPVIIFWKLYSNVDEISLLSSFTIILISLALSTLSYLFVEQPVRKTTLSDRTVLGIGASFILVFSVLFGILEKHDTASWRIRSYAENQQKSIEHYTSGCRKEFKNGILYFNCTDPDGVVPPVVALVGDSHSPHFLDGILAWAEKNGYDVAYQALAACPIMLGDIRFGSVFGAKQAAQCSESVSRFKRHIVDDPRVKIVLIAHRFDLFHTGLSFANKTKPLIYFLDENGLKIKDHTAYYRSQLKGTVEAIRREGKLPVIMKQIPLFDGVKDCDWEPLIKRLLHKERSCEFDKPFIARWQQPSIDFIDDFVAVHNVPALDPMPFFSSPRHRGRNLYRDRDHLNEYGEEFMVPGVVDAMESIVKDSN